MKLIYEDVHTKETREIEFSVRHFRSRESTGRRWAQKGGYTVMTTNGPKTPYVVVSACSDEDTFDRKLGVELCVKKYLERNGFKPSILYVISGHANPLRDASTVNFDKHGKVFNVLVEQINQNCKFS